MPRSHRTASLASLARPLALVALLAPGLAACAVLLSPTAARAQTVIDGSQVTFAWDPASGAVDHYGVWVSRNDSTFTTDPNLLVTDTSVTLTGDPGDLLAIQVAAFDATDVQGPVSAPSPTIQLAEAPPPPPPPIFTFVADEGVALEDVLAQWPDGEQLALQIRGDGKRFFDVGVSQPPPSGELGIDLLVVGEPDQPTTVRLLDVAALENGAVPIDSVTLFGTGVGDPCARTGTGLVIQPGSVLVLGGLDLFAFDGDTCVHVNEQFPSDGPDPNAIAWGGGEIHLYGDIEDDGVMDPDDNCLLEANPGQCDGNADGFGNACDGDIDASGLVGISDYGPFRDAYGSMEGDANYRPELDFDCDGGIGLPDFSTFGKRFGEAPGPSGLSCAGTVPCPAQ